MFSPADNPDRAAPARLGLAAALSVLAHAGGVAWVVTSPALLGATVPLEPIDAAESEPPIRPGIDQSRHVTINWLGFDDATAHNARPAEVEQAALTPNPGASAVHPSPDTAPAPEAVEIVAADAEQTPVTERALADAAPLIAVESPDVALVLPERQSGQSIRLPELSVGAETASRTQTSPPSGRPGELSEKEADPTSKQKPVEWVLGRPPAVEGLDITTVRPRWTLTTRYTSVPRNPLVKISFGRDGRVRKAEFLPGHTSGYPDVDGPLLDALYRWTARGKALDDLPDAGDPVVSIEMLIVLNRSRGTIRKPGSNR